MGTSNGHFTVLEPLQHELYTCMPRASGLAASICLLVSEKVEFTRVRRCFLRVLGKLRLSDQVIDRLAWNTTANYMDFLP